MNRLNRSAAGGNTQDPRAAGRNERQPVKREHMKQNQGLGIQRKSSRRWLRKTLALLLAAALWLSAAAVMGAEKKEGGSPVNLPELRRLLEVARESGFSEDEIRQISIEDDGTLLKFARKSGFNQDDIKNILTKSGNEIVVWEYLSVLDAKIKSIADREKAMREKDYLTVQDVFIEMRKTDPEELTELRKQTRFKD